MHKVFVLLNFILLSGNKINFYNNNINHLYLHFDKLASIKVFKSRNDYIVKNRSLSIIDLIVLDGIFTYNKSKLGLIYFKDSEWKDVDTNFLPFRRIGRVELCNLEDAQIKLNMMGKVKIEEVETLYF